MSSPRVPSDFPGFALRRIRAGEWSAFRELRLRALTVDPLAFGSTRLRESEYPDDLWKDRTARGASSTESAIFVAVTGQGDLAGMVSIAFVAGRWNVFGMWVDPSFRHQGLGGRLLEHGIAWLRSAAGHLTLHLEVNPKQEDAVHLYEHHGFRRTGVSTPLGHTEGESTVSMELDVR